jgi:hypothetical protein
MGSESPVISIVIIAKSEKEIDNWKQKIEPQTYDNYEIVKSTKEGIPEAWSEAISKASGEILLFTETDTHPISPDWLETIVDEFEPESDNVVHFGEFRGYGSYNFSNLAMDPDLPKEFDIDNTLTVGEDTEWFARMDKKGINFDQRPTAPVYHHPRPIEREVSRSFEYGLTNAKTIYRHGRIGPGTNTSNTTIGSNSSLVDWFWLFFDRGKQVTLKFCSSVLYWAGLFIGLIIYAPSKLRNNK